MARKKIENIEVKVAPKTRKKSDVKKLKLLVTIVPRSRVLLYIDVIEQFEVNMQTVIYGKGTASNEMLSLLGLAESDKAVILSMIREDKVKRDAQDIKEASTNLLELISHAFFQMQHCRFLHSHYHSILLHSKKCIDL